ncbi:MAG: TRAM domain-containing protein [Kiritimatiellae bacterium]|nr:TRAM domain-containing protein [Kiritimatiellia bacterium]
MTSSVYIAKNVYGGDGIGRLGDGRVVFVPGAWAGEQVKAEITEEKRHWVKARLVAVEEPSPERVDGGARVPGMVYANLSFNGEMAAKEAQLKEFFERARIRIPRFETAPQTDPLHYRNKVVYHFARVSGRLLLGYREESSHEIFDIREDPLARPEINAKIPEIRQSIETLLATGAPAVRKSVEREAKATVRWTARSGVQWWIGKPHHPVVLREVVCGKVFEVPADGFFQVNPAMGDALAKAVVAAYESGRDSAPELVDLYCGVGVFGLCCRPPRLTGVESGRQAVEFANKNAALQGFAPARFYSEEVGRNIRRLPLNPRACVILDPPRGGLEPNVPGALCESKARRIVYVSCDPATLMRDLKNLVKAFDVESVAWFNMFPRTARFETMVVLSRRGAG